MKTRLQDILRIALKYHVTDIHFSLIERYQEEVHIEMRVNGVIQKVRPKKEDVSLFHYLMYRANLDITSAFVPQTGSFEEEVDGRKLSLRFALVTSFQRTSGVLRILNSTHTLEIDKLTVDEDVKVWLSGITRHRTGLFLLSGPTGSGKTTTLYTLLNACKGKKIFTLEDPIEVFSENYIQLQINDRQHLSYADGIKQLMRHDPDIIMIGEIRDTEAAQMAVRCGLTGHLVLSTLHATDCTGAIHRMMDLGVPSYQLEEVLCGVSNQRLFTNTHEGKTGIYEYMNRKEIRRWFTEHAVSETFIPLQKRMEHAVHIKELEYSEVESEFIE